MAKRLTRILWSECAKRWTHCLDPALDRSEWTPEEVSIRLDVSVTCLVGGVLYGRFPGQRLTFVHLPLLRFKVPLLVSRTYGQIPLNRSSLRRRIFDGSNIRHQPVLTVSLYRFMG